MSKMSKTNQAIVASLRRAARKETASVRDQIIDYFKTNDAPGDGEIHQLAKRVGLTPEAFEAEIYKLLADLIRGKGAVVASVETAGSLGKREAAFVSALKAAGVGVEAVKGKREPTFTLTKFSTRAVDKAMKVANYESQGDFNDGLIYLQDKKSEVLCVIVPKGSTATLEFSGY